MPSGLDRAGEDGRPLRPREASGNDAGEPGSTKTPEDRRSSSRAEKAIPWVSGVLAAMPVLLSPYPPMTDFPRQEALVALLRYLDETTRSPSGLYVLNLGHSDQLFHLLAWPLSTIVPVTLACKLVVAASLLAIPLATARLARHRGSSAWVAPATVPIALGWTLSRGFVSDLLGLAILLAFLPLLDRFSRAPTWRMFGGAVTGTFVLYLANPLSLLVYVVGAFAFAALEPLGKMTLLRTMPGLAGLAMIGADILHRVGPARPSLLKAVSLRAKIIDLPERLVGMSDQGSSWILFGSCLLFLAMISVRRLTIRPRIVTGEPAPGGRVGRLQHRLRPYRFAILAGICAMGYLAIPASLNGTSLAYQRLLAPTYALIAVSAGVTFAAQPKLLIRLLAAALPMESLLVLWPACVDASRNAEYLDTLLTRIPMKSSVASIDLRDSELRPYDAGTVYHRVLVARGGRVLDSPTDAATAPVVMQRQVRWNEAARRVTDDALALRPTQDLTRFQYVLVHSGSTDNTRIVAAALLPDATFVDTAGEWALFRSTHATVPLDTPEPPAPAPPPLTLRERIMVLARRASTPPHQRQ